MSSFILLLRSLPLILGLIKEVKELLRSTFGDNPEKAIEDLTRGIEMAKVAKTTQEKKDAAIQIAVSLNRVK